MNQLFLYFHISPFYLICSSSDLSVWLLRFLHRPLIRKCVCTCSRQGLRVHYPSQTAAPSRGFPDFLLRAPAASVAQPESGSTTEVSDSDEEDEGGEERPLAAAEPVAPVPPASPRHNASIQQAPSQEAGPNSEWGPCSSVLCSLNPV